jgi:hypothetical protein
MSRYNNNKIEKSTKTSVRPYSVNKYNTIIYDTVPERNDDIYLITQDGDRCDSLAHRFYGDTQLWWFIAHVNNLNSMNIEANTSLRIPLSTQNAKGE